MKTAHKEVLKLISVPVALLVIYLILALIWKLLNLPSDDELVPIVKNYFAQYGLWLVFVGALIEGFLLLGQYFPGGFIIFLGVITAGKDIPRAAEVVAIVSIAFFISYTLNYWVGKYGWYKLLVKFGLKKSLDDAQQKLIKQGMNAVIFSYWEPNLASITATAAGVLQIPLRKFLVYSAAGVIIWNIFWGTLVFTLGESALNIIGFKYVIVIFGVWVAIILLKKYVWDRYVRKSVIKIWQ